MKKTIIKAASIFFALNFASFFFEPECYAEPVADFTLDMSYFEKKEKSQKTDSAGQNGVKNSAEKNDGSAKKAYRIAEPKRKEIGMNGVFKDQTVSYREKYLSPSGRKWLSEVLWDSAPYRPYIRRQLKAKKMPMFLQYLPVIESNYKPTAVSPSGAVGLWQFMPNSMAPFLKKNEYFDERRDPWKETDAALSKLQDNYKMFGDWNLAIAAYNMGAGAVGRVVKAHPGKDFWYLCEKGLLSRQASDYVPKLIAVTDIVENADFYGALEIGVADKAIEGTEIQKFSYLKVKGSIKLSTVAEAADVPLETVRLLNLELLKEITPPKTEYTIRLPEGKAKTASSALKSRN